MSERYGEPVSDRRARASTNTDPNRREHAHPEVATPGGADVVAEQTRPVRAVALLGGRGSTADVPGTPAGAQPRTGVTTTTPAIDQPPWSPVCRFGDPGVVDGLGLIPLSERWSALPAGRPDSP